MISKSQSPSAERFLARLTIVCASFALFLLVIQHGLRPDLDPMSHVLSEYALGPLGWVQVLWFSSLSIACTALSVALLPWLRGPRGWIGLLGLLAAALGLAMAAVYPMDPLTVPMDQASHSAKMHNLSAMIGNPGFLLGSLLLSLTLRGQQPWVPSARNLMRAAHLFWISFVLMAAAIFAAFSQQPPADMNLIGLANRVLGAALSIWPIVAALPLAQSSRDYGRVSESAA